MERACRLEPCRYCPSPLKPLLMGMLILALAGPAFATHVAMSPDPVWQVTGTIPTGVGWADFDANGWLDLVITHGLDVIASPDAVYFNTDGILSFTPGWISEASLPSANVFLGDLDNDGDPDLAVSSLGITSQGLPPVPHTIYFNNGGLPPNPDWVSLPGNAFSCAGGDVDGDGDIDIAFGQGDFATNHFQKTVLYLNENGDFGQSPTWETADLLHSAEVAFADVDRDGDLDLALGGRNSFGLAIFFNDQGILETTPSWQTSAVITGRQMAFGDVNGDGFLDLAVAGGAQSFFLFRNINGTLETTPSWSAVAGGEPSAVAWADVDGDGDLDLAAGGWYPPMGIFENVNGTLSSTFVWSYNCGVQQFAWGDFDGDYLVDTVSTITADGASGLFYLDHRPIHRLNWVALNGLPLPLDQFCHDPVEGWLSLGMVPQAGDTLTVSYSHSKDLDLAVTDASQTRIFSNLKPVPPFVVPDFEAAPCTGHAPLAVQFTDLTYAEPAIVAWSWDLNGDGITDSQVQHPAWIYDSPGSFTVTLEASNGLTAAIIEKEACVNVFSGESAVAFDGNSGNVRCPASPSMAISDAVTAEAWIKPQGWGEVPTTGFGRIIDKTNFALYLHGEGSAYNQHSMVFLLRNTNGPPVVLTTPPGSIQLDAWQHVAATYTAATSEAAVYLDGMRQDLNQVNTPAGPIKDNLGIDLLIGTNPASLNTFDGAIDEVRLWNVARTAQEIAADRLHGLTGGQPELVGYWRFNEGNGVYALDGSANGNNGVISDGRWVLGALDPSAAIPPGQGASAIPQRLTLSLGWPNPFAVHTTVLCDLSTDATVTAAVYDMNGRLVRSLCRCEWPAGPHSIVWDGTDDAGSAVASGVYFCGVTAGAEAARRVALVCVR
ncbi:VCBS repeat-containing protein [Candidatus Fermentibacteria bacterium]|nr:VCBS repeat-containing protein [Candidatus Fermentibacteria bacterium]